MQTYLKVMTFVKVKKLTPQYPKESEEASVTSAVRKLYCKHNRAQVGRKSAAQNLSF
jgi:hypothetical protein